MFNKPRYTTKATLLLVLVQYLWKLPAVQYICMSFAPENIYVRHRYSKLSQVITYQWLSMQGGEINVIPGLTSANGSKLLVLNPISRYPLYIHIHNRFFICVFVHFGMIFVHFHG